MTLDLNDVEKQRENNALIGRRTIGDYKANIIWPADKGCKKDYQAGAWRGFSPSDYPGTELEDQGIVKEH